MNTLHKISVTQLCRLVAAGLALLTVCACSALRPTAAQHTAFYSLNNTQTEVTPPAPATAPTLIINPPHAAAGFDSSRVIYMRENHQIEYFANSEWVDPPARMLGPILVAAIEKTGAFRAVVLTPGAATGDLRLDTEIIRLQQEFQTQPPSRVRFTLRAYLVDEKTRRVLAWREFEATVAATSEDPYGGIVAANRAVQTVLSELSAFLAPVARSARLER